mgnify:FL=1|jgi:putative FmdB family regulatory protein|tara:strand:+ start:500 stop:898 length:399 start_codon:yes stop_codon:yes gene_type:complete
MPLYDFACNDCEYEDEFFRSFNEEEPPQCDKCGATMYQKISLWANTPGRWGDSHGYFDRGLGTYVNNFAHRDKLMKEKGVQPVSNQDMEEYSHDVYAENKQHHKDVTTYTDTLKKTNSHAEAAAAAFPCNDI